MAQIILTVSDISCEHCERTVTEALQPVEGVRSVRVDIPAQKVRVEYDEGTVSVERMKEVLQAEDYPVASVEPAGAGPA
jgi:copper chaperone CopZ